MVISGLFKNAERLCVALTLILFLGGLAGVRLVGASETPKRQDLLQQAEVDLNGDGKSERITFNIDPKAGKFTITVAGSSQSGKFESANPPEGFAIVDIDKEDKYKEIFVRCWGDNDIYENYIFAYDGKTLNRIGQFTGEVEFPGDGIVRVKTWEGFWKIHNKYVLERPKHTLKKVPQEFYYVGVSATVKKTFPIYATRKDQTMVANVKPGSGVIILLCAPFQENPKWYLLKTDTGLIGWIKGKIINQDNLDGIPWAV